MSCYHPMVRIETSNMTDPKQREIAYRLTMDHRKTKRSRFVTGMLIPRELAINEGIDLKLNNAILVPCGRCIGCRLDYSR